jgi:hypothetical protein
MTIDQLFALPFGTRLSHEYPRADPAMGEIVAADADEVLIRWIATEDVSSIERRDDESAKLLESLSVVQLPADLPENAPVEVTDMGKGD